MPFHVVHDPDQVKLSTFDLNQLRSSEITILHAVHEDGSSTNQIMYELIRAFRQGFTAVNRGEAEGQLHPARPDWQTDLDTPRFRRGHRVRWRNSKGKPFQGSVIGVVPPGERPDPKQFPRFAKEFASLRPRPDFSYIVFVEFTHKGKYFWPDATLVPLDPSEVDEGVGYPNASPKPPVAATANEGKPVNPANLGMERIKGLQAKRRNPGQGVPPRRSSE